MNIIELLHDYFVERAFAIYQDAPKTAMEILNLAYQAKRLSMFDMANFGSLFNKFLDWQNAVLEIKEQNRNGDLKNSLALVSDATIKQLDEVEYAFFVKYPYAKNDETKSLFRRIVENFGEKHHEQR